MKQRTMAVPLYALLLLLTLQVATMPQGVHGCSMMNNDNTEQRGAQLADSATAKKMPEITMQEAVAQCNRTFVIQPDYLAELNETGSFPDETDRIPLCFIRCYLQTLGILTEDDKVNKETALALNWATSSETVDECLDEMTGSGCEKAYLFTRCIMTRALVDGKSKDNK
ncbi:general odorant-binding protein 84a-like [Anopheles stephensi]|uniref:general odorant-binding protein 84a-like n=1 Tax=Anopheles stephensi TaxID=30069 RepID=UPI001658AD4D|nr:general odorant-binding protein 84a-like [Anopheles stephensi]XP_035917842.1 general odorant-binding protein 84a-like [Anopheles stephensi]